MATIDNSLTTVERFKEYHGITVDTHDTVISRLIIGVSAFVEKYCKREFKRQAFTNVEYNGRGTSKLLLKHYPIDSGQTFSIQERGGLGHDWGSTDWDSFESADYRVDYEKGIVVANRNFQEGFLNFRASYTAGFYLPSNASFQDGTDDDKDLPYDLENAVWDLVAGTFDNRKSNKKISTQQVRDVSITYMKELRMNPDIKIILDSYRRAVYA